MIYPTRIVTCQIFLNQKRIVILMGKITEAALRSALKSGKFERVYFLFGEEDFLTKTYADRIIDAAVPEKNHFLSSFFFERKNFG